MNAAVGTRDVASADSPVPRARKYTDPIVTPCRRHPTTCWSTPEKTTWSLCPAFSDREALTFRAGHHVLFCCILNEDSPLPEEALAALPSRLVIAATTPDWIVLFGNLDPAYVAKIADFSTMAAQPGVFYYPTQRPEITRTSLARTPGPCA